MKLDNILGNAGRLSLNRIIFSLALVVVLSSFTFYMQTHYVYAQQSTTMVSLRIYSNTSWQAIIGPAGNQNSANGYGDSYRNMDCATGNSYSVSVQLPASADASKYVVINLYENGNTVRVASAQGPNGIASFSGQCGVWEYSNSNNGLISVQTDKSSYNYGDTIHMYASLIHVDSPNLVKPIGKFKVVSSADGSVLFEKSETNGCCSELVDIRGSLWEKNTPFYVVFGWGSSDYNWFVYTPIHITGFEKNPSTNIQTPLVKQLISVQTDKSSYNYGDLIHISGNVNPVVPNQNVTLNFYINGQWEASTTSSPNLDGSYFSTTFEIVNMPVPQGIMTISASYEGASNESTINYNSLSQSTSTASSQVQQQPIPEFSSLTGMIIVISIIGVLILSRRIKQYEL